MLAGAFQSIGFTARAADEAIVVTGTDGDGDIGTSREIAENEPAIPKAGFPESDAFTEYPDMTGSPDPAREVDDAVRVTPEQESPYNQMGNVEEGYNAADNSVDFTVSVSGDDPDPVNALYGLEVSVDLRDVFIIDGAEPDMIMPGGQAGFTLKPLENLPAGTYRPVVTFRADNLKTPIERRLIFVVTESETFSTYAVTDDADHEVLYHRGQHGWTLEGGFKSRLENALKEMKTIRADNYAIQGDSLVTGFYINLNGNTADDPDVKVYNNGGILTVTKLPTCNVDRYETVLENTGFEPGSQSFRCLNFRILETVELDLENVSEDLVETRDGGVIADEEDLGPVNGQKFQTWIKDLPGDAADKSGLKFRFLVPFGQAFNKAEEKISYNKAAVGLPYMNITAYTEGRDSDDFLFIVKEDSPIFTGLTGNTIIRNDVGARTGWIQPHDNRWTVFFNWISVSRDVADTRVEASAYCKAGGVIVPATDLKLSSKPVGTTIEYTAEAKDPDGKVYYSYKNVDKNGVVRDGRAGQVLTGDIVVVGLEEEYPYTGKAITPSFYVMDGDVVLAKDGDYTVKYRNNRKVGDATIEIKGKGNYKGKNDVVKFRIYDPYEKAVADGVKLTAGVKGIARIEGTYVYNGRAQYPASITVILPGKDNTIVMDHEGDGVYTNDGEETVVISIVNNVDKGTAVVAAVGADGRVRTGTFAIKAAPISDAKIAEGPEAGYSVKGAIPAGLEIKWKNADEEEVTLINRQDFTVKYSNNKEAGTGMIRVTGKKNFKGRLEGSFTINALEVDGIAAVNASTGMKAGKVKALVLDRQGFRVPDGKLNVSVSDEEGNAVGPDDRLAAGAKITVVVTSADPANVAIAEKGITAETAVGDKMSSVKAKADNLTKTYTGEPIELDEEDMGRVNVTFGRTQLVYGEEFVIVGYAKNVNKGKMTVYIAGTGKATGRGTFSGIKSFTVRIVPRSLQ